MFQTGAETVRRLLPPVHQHQPTQTGYSGREGVKRLVTYETVSSTQLHDTLVFEMLNFFAFVISIDKPAIFQI